MGSPSVVVVDVVVVVTLVLVFGKVVDVIEPAHGQSIATGRPVATARHASASVAETGSDPVGAQMHSGSQTWEPTAAAG
jgi:hypothetical protein